MRRRVWSFILIASMLLVLTPDTVMAARMEEKSLHLRESAEQTNVEEETDSVPEAETEAGTGSVLGMEGVGTATAPYRIQSAEQLCAFADLVNGADGVPNTGLCAILTQNIDLSGVCGDDIGSWTPIGTEKNPYTGIFDGGSFTVSGLYYHKSNASYTGLFGCNAGMIKNLGIVGADIAAGNYTGSVCGFNRGTITGCYNTASVKGARYTGGVCGYNNGSGTISVCYNTGAVSGSKYVGGICGYNKNETSSCYNMGVVNGSGTSVGGICGYNKKLVFGCYNAGEIGGKGANYVGSVCGYNHSKSAFLNCYYLITGTEKGNYGVAMTRQQFASGEVCWLLNEGKSENVVWYQTCGAGFPTFGGKTVYQTQTYRQSGNTKEVIVAYTNDKNKRSMSSQTASAAMIESDTNSGETTGVNTGGHVYQEPEWKWKEYKSATAVFTCQDCGEQLTLKAKISKKEKKATCVVDGETVYTASVERDGEIYEDKKTVKLAKTGHQTLEPVTAKPATCEESGISQDCWICPACKKYFTDQQGTTEIPRNEVVVKALGHEYQGEPEWSWTGDYSLFTAKFICARSSCGKTDEIEVKPEVETKATCMVAGTTTYRATVKFNGKNYKHAETITGEKLPHDYGRGPEWKWEDNYSAATATFTCAYGCGTTETLTAKATAEETAKATCMAAGEIVYTAVVTFGGREYSDVKRETLAKTDHSYGEPELEVDYPTATFIFTCVNCGTEIPVEATNVTKSETQGAGCGTPGTITYKATVTFQGKLYEKTKEEKMPVAHNLTHYEAKQATCVSEGNEEYWKCSNCGKFFADAEGEEELPGIPILLKTDHMLGPDGPQWNWEKKDDRWSCDDAVCTCVYCGTSKTVPVTVSEDKTEPTCMAEGQIVYTAVTTFGGTEYSDDKTVLLDKTNHNYKGPEWTWALDVPSATAIFTCDICGTSKSVVADVTKPDLSGVDCGTPKKVTYKAKVTFENNTYEKESEPVEILAEHTLRHYEAKPVTCVDAGNEEYWKCEKCGKYFGDEEGTDEILDVVIPATGHKLEHVAGNRYRCTACQGEFIVSEAADGTTRVYSVEDDAVIPQDEQGIDSNADFSDPDEVKQNDEDLTGVEKSEEETVETEPSVQSGSEEDQNDSAPPAADVQDSQNGENEQGETDGQGAVGEPAGQNEQVEEGISVEQDEQQESGDGIIDTQEDAARYGIIYPEGEEVENATVTEGAVEGNAVNLRADTSGDDAVQAAQGQQEFSLWGSAAALSLLVGIILCFVLKKENN